MKKLLFLGLSLLVCSTYTVANSSNDNDHNTKVNIFYGTKASHNATNPCKGPTIRKCGEIVATYEDNGDGQTFVTRTVKDANGNIITIQHFIAPKDSTFHGEEVTFEDDTNNTENGDE